MRFLVDECTGKWVGRWLREQGHEVFSVFEEARGMEDDEVIGKAYAENRILITNDKDFGEQVYRERRPHGKVSPTKTILSLPRGVSKRHRGVKKRLYGPLRWLCSVYRSLCGLCNCSCNVRRWLCSA